MYRAGIQGRKISSAERYTNGRGLPSMKAVAVGEEAMNASQTRSAEQTGQHAQIGQGATYQHLGSRPHSFPFLITHPFPASPTDFRWPRHHQMQ